MPSLRVPNCPKIPSLSWTRKRGTEPNGVASLIRCFSQARVGDAVTARWTTRLHPQFRPELQRDPVLAPLRMIGRDAADEVDVVSAEPDPEHSVSGPEERPGSLPLKHSNLVTKDGVLGGQGGPGSNHTSEGASDQKEP